MSFKKKNKVSHSSYSDAFDQNSIPETNTQMKHLSAVFKLQTCLFFSLSIDYPSCCVQRYCYFHKLWYLDVTISNYNQLSNCSVFRFGIWRMAAILLQDRLLLLPCSASSKHRQPLMYKVGIPQLTLCSPRSVTGSSPSVALL